jgi:crotonobetainyl-CoA:carnitine CoA-transferase CaiB-like acyl-CoA transferase
MSNDIDPRPGPRSAALSHLTICDLTGQLAGASATRFLAAFGARVIRVEDPVRQGRWDILRGSPPYVAAGDRARRLLQQSQRREARGDHQPQGRGGP